MTRPKWSRDPAAVGHVFTHITFDGIGGERVFDFQLDLNVRDVLCLNRPEGDRFYVVTDRTMVVIDAPQRPDQPDYTTFVQFIRCEEISSDMPADEAPLSHPPAKVPRTNKEKR